MKKILVPCDFSKPAVNAFRFALDIARQSKGHVHLLNVVELPVLHDTLLMPVLNFEAELLKDMKEKAKVEFEKLVMMYKINDVKVSFKVEFGPVFGKVLEYIKEHAIDLVLMGSRGAGGLSEIFIGSNAERMVRKSPVPVLVLKDHFSGPIRDIVFPNSLETEHQENLTMKVKALQNFFHATLHIVWINTPVNFTSDNITYERLEEFAKRYMLKDYTLNVFNHTGEEEGILQFSRKINGQLIAMGTHSRKRVSHLLNGSLAEDIVNHTKNLVWTYSLKNELIEA